MPSLSRTLVATARDRASKLPIVTVTGPRQSGKTTFCKAVWANKPYVLLETPDVLARALADPRDFLDRLKGGAILDEIQNAPVLLSYLQGITDADPTPGAWILTGSQHFAIVEGISQSLAGRPAMLELQPFSVEELREAFPGRELAEHALNGGYPRIWTGGVDRSSWLADYVMNYIERDLRRIVEIGDLATFLTFLRLCAGRTGQVLNVASLGEDAGVTHTTARRWLSALEASYVVHRLPPVHRNVSKRLVKSPKLHFLDTGLACHLLGIRDANDFAFHPLRGALFESWVVSEIRKARIHRGLQPDLAYYREGTGREVDLVVERGLDPIVVEIKSSVTAPLDAAKALLPAVETLGRASVASRSITKRVVYAGNERFSVQGTEFVPWNGLDRVAWS
ncbi:MAG: ATP-binding protein [Planctomycetes bacterium]|nr:ATP-binding protein [Planctomycetota bacterium]